MTSRIDMTGQELRELVWSMAPQSTAASPRTQARDYRLSFTPNWLRPASVSRTLWQALQLQPPVFLGQRDGAVDFLRVPEDKTAGDRMHHGPAPGLRRPCTPRRRERSGGPKSHFVKPSRRPSGPSSSGLQGLQTDRLRICEAFATPRSRRRWPAME